MTNDKTMTKAWQKTKFDHESRGEIYHTQQGQDPMP